LHFAVAAFGRQMELVHERLAHTVCAVDALAIEVFHLPVDSFLAGRES